MEVHNIIDNRAIGQRIRKEREKLSLSRSNFAELIELSDYYVGQLERGERQMSLNVLFKIAKCLHVSLDYLILGDSKYDSYYFRDGSTPYSLDIIKDRELCELIEKCSPKELELIKKIIKLIITHTD